MIGRFEYPPALDRDARDKVLRKARTGDSEAMRAAIAGNMRLVGLLAEKFAERHGCLELREELVQSAICDHGGLVRAIQRFDPSRGYQFSSFARRWIWGSFCRTLELHRDWSEVELPPEYSEDADEHEAVSDGYSEDDAIAAIDRGEDKDTLSCCISMLPDLERAVVSRVFGLATGREEEPRAIAKHLGLTTRAVSDALACGLARLRELMGPEDAA